MRRSFVMFAAVIAAFSVLVSSTFAGAPDLPTINGNPSPFVTVASGTGTATEYLEYIPLTWDPSTQKLFASGVPLIFQVVGSTTVTASGTTDVRITSHTASLPSGTNTIGSVTLTIPGTASQTVVTAASGTTTVITAWSGRTRLTLWATGTFLYSIGTTTPILTTPMVYNFSDDIPASVPVSVTTQATDTVVGVLQR